MTERLRIRGGRVYDPQNGVDGEVRDVCIADGRVADDLPAGAPVLDARGLVVMPGGVDIHCHIAGPKVNLGRRLDPQRRRGDVLPRRTVEGDGAPAVLRSGTGGIVPSTFATGYRYAGLGYTTAFDAAVPALGARHAHHELDDTPVIDKGFYLLLGNDDFLLHLLESGAEERVPGHVANMLRATRGYAVKVVNPGGVLAWKGGQVVDTLDQPVGEGGVTPRRIVRAISGAVDALRLPHPMHIHCNDLGQPGNCATTLDTMRALEGRRAHFAHVQFHSYGGERGGRPVSGARELIEYVNAHPELSADVGQVMFGDVMTMTADTRVEFLLHQLTGNKWVDVDLELESGCGVVPYAYRERNYVHALQWAIGLEWFLLSADPWRVVLSTDHPNGGSFLSYPRLIRLLMDRSFRDEQIARVHPEAVAATALADGLAREYSLGEIAVITRAGPARQLGLRRKGHLGPGADADVTVYAPDADWERMFSTPRWVVKAGEIVVEDGQVRREHYGSTLHVVPEADREAEARFREWVRGRGTVDWEQYQIDAEELRRGAAISVGEA